MKLKALRWFNEYGIAAHAGQVLEFSDTFGVYLIENFPAAWEIYVEPVVVQPVIEAIEAPPVDKMIRKPKGRK